MLANFSNVLIHSKGSGVFALFVFSIVLLPRLLSPWSFILLTALCTPLILLWILYAQAQLYLSVDDGLIRSNLGEGLRTSARSFLFTTPAAWQAVLTRSKWSFSDSHDLPPLVPAFPQFSHAVNEIIILTVRDFVLSWYTPISPSPSFPSALSDTLRVSVQRLAERVQTIDLPSLVVRRILPKINIHVDRFRDSEKTLRGAGLERHLTQSDELDILLASRYASGGTRLHTAVCNLSSTITKYSEDAYLRFLMDRALPLLLPKREAKSRAVHIVAREVLCCTVLVPIMEMLADPDFWNFTIDQLAGAAIREQKLVSRVRRLLEAQPGPTASLGSRSESRRNSTGDATPIRPSSTRLRPQYFDLFLKSIERCDSLLDARRLKNDIDAEIRKTQVVLESPSDELSGTISMERTAAYLQRLYTAKRKVEHRITALGGVSEPSQVVTNTRSTSIDPKLRDVLTSPATLSYFMEFMDRRQRALLVQFWLTIETFKDPLGVVVESDSLVELPHETAQLLPLNSIVDDVRMVYDLYFSSDVAKKSTLLDAISPHHINTIQTFVADSPVTSHEAFPSRAKKVRHAVLIAQNQVEDDMTDDFAEFKQSDLWFRVTNEHARQDDNSAVEPVFHDSSAVRRPLPTNMGSPTVSRAPLKDVDTVQSRVFPTFILPGVSGGSDARGADIILPASPRPRVRSFQSERGAPRSPSDSPLSKSVECFPESRRFSAALEFLVTDPHLGARAPLFDDPDLLREEQAYAKRMEALQTALTDLIADDSRRRPSSDQKLSETSHSSPASEEQIGLDHPPSSLLADYDRDDNLLEAGSIERELEPPDRGFRTKDLGEQEDEDGADVQNNIRATAAPGDLLLSYDIARLEDKIQKLQSQEVMLEALSRKADLTGDGAELKLLSRSKASVAKEIRELSFQKTQYEIQEKENRLDPNRTRIFISSSMTTETEGKHVVRYVVEVQQLNPEGRPIFGWMVSRRYNEFFAMHQKLKERYTSVRNLDFPGKRLVTALSNSFIDSRRKTLEVYLQNLLLNPVLCKSEELRVFLSRQSTFTEAGNRNVPRSHSSFPGQDIVRNVYRSVAESIDDMFFGPSMLDIMIQRLSRQAAEVAGIIGSAANDEDLIANAVKPPDEVFLQLPVDLEVLAGEASVTSFTAPICDLVLSVFELDSKKNWLRRQAVVVILQQVLGGTIERKFRDNLAIYLNDSHLWSYLNFVKDTMWSGGQKRSPPPARTQEEKTRTRDDAQKKLSTLMPALAANMIGRSNARRGAKRMFAVLQNRRLNQHIVYTVLDEIFEALFPELSKSVDTAHP